MVNNKKHDAAFLLARNESCHMNYITPYLDYSDDKILIDIENISNFNLHNYSMLLTSNYYHSIESILYNQSYYNIYICHGIPHKLLNSENYNWFWTYDTCVLFSQKDVIQIAAFKDIELPDLKNKKSILLEHNGRKHLYIIGGNQRMKHYLKSPTLSKDIYQKYPTLDPDKKTLLYMPTTNSLHFTRGKNLCGIDFFCTKIIPNLKAEYNLIIKCHPHNRNDEIAYMLLNSIQDFYPDLLIDFDSNYLEFMQVSDLLFSDYSSAGYDYLYYNKPIIFLDKFDEIYEKPDLENIFHPYWFFGAGENITQTNALKIDEIIQDQLKNDPYQSIRKTYKEMSFDDTLSAEEILNECRKHPKYER